MVSRSIGDLTERQRDGLALASGFVFAASSPPFDLTIGILVGLGLWAFSRPNARRGFLFGLAANLEALRFVPRVIQTFTTLPLAAALLALVLLSAAQAVPWTLGGLLMRRLRERHGVPAPLAFALGVYGATLVPAVFPWTPAGGLSGWPILLQTAEAVGERGVSLLLALGCALLVTFERRPAALGAATFAMLLGHGAVRMRSIDEARAAAPRPKVALVMPDFEAKLRTTEGTGASMMERLSRLTVDAERKGAELTVWPESAYPYVLRHGLARSPSGDRHFLQDGVHGPVLTGAYLSKGKGVGTNSAVLVLPDGSIGPSYDKRHLLWFGETVPLADVLPILRTIFARGTGIDAGTESIAMKAGPVVASVLNCYEDTLPIAGREAMGPRPNLLVNVTNDAWFAGTEESELHLRTAVPRAIETRRDLVRAVNRGPTTWVDASGRIVARLDPAKGPDILMTTPALLETPPTLYTRAGELPLFAMAVAVVLWRTLRHKSTAGAASTKEGAPAVS